MSTPQAPAAPLAGGGTSSLADGVWHRLHPLTPLFQGGLVLIIVAGVVISNFRDHAIFWAISIFAPSEAGELVSAPEDEWVGFLVENNLIVVGLLVVLAILVILIGIFWMIWRFHQFRISDDEVEVRKGIVFRSHRRAPLDRVQGVNLTRPFPMRLIGMAKLEVLGAGTGANVDLEYLSTTKAEEVRADILRLASGARAAREAARDAAEGIVRPPHERLVDSLSHGVTGLIEGVDHQDVAPESVVHIPAGRLIGAYLLDGIWWIIGFGVLWVGSVLVPLLIAGDEPGWGGISLAIGLGAGVPMAFAVVAIMWAQISKSLRYAIAPTPDGIRVTFGLLTTVTETLPPGRIYAVEVSQSLLWRPFGWWTIRINRMSGKSAEQQASGSAQQFNTVLPVGTRADVERVLALLLPGVPVEHGPLMWEDGLLGPTTGAVDPYKTMAPRAWWRRPFSWKRHGFALTGEALMFRRGMVWRKLAVYPLARLQAVSVQQGPIDRLQRVAAAQVHTVVGPVSGHVVGLDRDDAIELLQRVSAAAVAAARADQTHRWSQHGAPSAAAGAPLAPSTRSAPVAPAAPEGLG